MTRTLQQVFDADLTRINDELIRLDAVVVLDDGEKFIDPTMVPEALLDTYTNLVSFGMANGLV